MGMVSRRQMLGLGAGTVAAALAAQVASAQSCITNPSPQITIFNVRGYGAVGNGIGNDSPAVQCAINALVSAGGGVLYFPAGIYRLDSAILLSNFSSSIVGDGIGDTTLYFPTTDGVRIDNQLWTQPLRPAVRIEDLTLSTGMNGAGTALSYLGPAGLNMEKTLGRQLSVRHVQICGSDYSKAWNTGIDLNRGGMSEFVGIYMIGHTVNIHAMSHGFRLTNISTDVHISGGSFYWMHHGVLIDGNLSSGSTDAGEGIYVAESVFVQVYIGVMARNSAGNYIEISHNHFDVHDAGVILGSPGVIGSNLCQVNHNLIFKNFLSHVYFKAIQMHGSRTAIIGNEILNVRDPETLNPPTGGGVGIVISSGSTMNRIVGNNITDQDAAVWLQAGSSGNLVASNTGSANLSGVLNQGSGNLVTDNLL